MTKPLVTFLSPCYNHSKYIIQSLESIKNQTYPNIQHIIIDDCSTDDSAEKIQKWIDANDYRCEFIRHEKNKGISFTQNESIDLTKGEYWTSVATDDFIEPARTEVFVKYLIEHRETNMITSDCKLVNEESREIQLSSGQYFLNFFYSPDFNRTIEQFGTYETLLKGNYIPSSIMIRANVFDRVGKFDTNLKVEDWDMWLRISQVSKIAFIDQPLTFYRYHDNNTIKHLDTRNDELLALLKQAKFNLPVKWDSYYWNMYINEFGKNIRRSPNIRYLIRYTPLFTLIRVFCHFVFCKFRNLFRKLFKK